jgi:signal transduction histidine kinase
MPRLAGAIMQRPAGAMMIDTLRGRLLLWFTATLVVIIAGFGSLVCYAAWCTHLLEVDDALAARADAIVGGVRPAPGGTFDVALPAAARAGSGVPAIYHAIWTGRGDLVDRSDAEIDVAPPVEDGFATRDGRRELAVRAPAGVVVLVGRDLSEARADLRTLAVAVTAIGLLAIALAVAGGWWLAGRALTPIDRISRTARAMADGDFAARVPIDRVETELGQVARALNDAFDRLHDSLERQRRFTADASHELRTPLTTLSTELQWALARPRSDAELHRTIETSLRATDRMTAVVERLLSLARAGAATADGPPRDVPLHDVVRTVLNDVAPLAAGRELTVTSTLATATVSGHPDRLREAISNVVVNAIQYNVAGGRVTVTLTTAGDDVTLTIADTGVGIAPDDVGRVFHPFFRADPARSRNIGGAGLGLAVSEAIIRAAGGSIRCRSELNKGTAIEICLPRANPSGDRAIG